MQRQRLVEGVFFGSVQQLQFLAQGVVLNKQKRKQPDRPTGADNESVLFERFLAGSDEAFRAFFLRHNQRLFSYCLKMTQSHQVAEDLTQEAWIRAIDLRTKNPSSIHNPVGLMVRIVRNLCIDHSRSKKDLQPLEEAHASDYPAYELHERSMEQEIVLRCLDRLPIDYREVLVLNIYSGYSCEDIAVMLDKSPDAIWARASRARKKLRAMVVVELEREKQGLRVLTQPNRKVR